MKKIRTPARLAAGVTLILVHLQITSAMASDVDPVTSNPNGPWYALDKPVGWHFDAGIGVESEPTYAGSSNSDSEIDLFARAIYRTKSGHRYFVTLGEVGVNFSLNPETQLSAFLEYEESREVDEEPALAGLDPVDSTVEGQLTLARRFGNASVFATLQPDLLGDANKGLVWFVGAGYDVMLANDRFRLSTRFDISGADSEHMNTEFGITEAEATRTGYRAFEPGGGLKSATLGINGEYYFNDRLSLLGTVETEYYLNDAAKSPLVDDIGRRTNVEASVLLRWQF